MSKCTYEKTVQFNLSVESDGDGVELSQDSLTGNGTAYIYIPAAYALEVCEAIASAHDIAVASPESERGE